MKQEIKEMDYREYLHIDYEKEPVSETYAFHSATEESTIYAAERKNLPREKN